MATLTIYTDAGDAFAYTNNNAFYGTTNQLYIGNASSGDYPCRACIPIKNVTIAQGTQITSATLKGYARNNRSGGTINYYVGCEDADNPTTPTSGSSLNGRAITTAKLSISSGASWTAGALKTFDITTSVQEVLDRSGFASGNQINVLIHDNGSTINYIRDISSYESRATYTEPCLEIIYPDVVTFIPHCLNII